ncbi:hypothetical protein [Micromonospora halophytica]|uniref:hypothetical protein n=1 Tax=Micromonospora halophytica TaxID=47864 RepID=UPI003CCBA0C1
MGDDLGLRDAEAVEHVEGGVFQADEAAAQGRGRRRRLKDGDIVESGVQQQQRGDRAGDTAADGGDAGPAGGCHEVPFCGVGTRARPCPGLRECAGGRASARSCQ